jgi:nucleotide-binding universal stress UspA family protein
VVPEPDAQFWKTYIYEVDNVDSKAKHDIDAKIQESYLPRVPKGVNLEIAIEVGKDYAKILEFADQKDVDLIIIGRQGRSSFGKVFFGSVTEKVTRKAKCAVLVVPLTYEQKHRSKA